VPRSFTEMRFFFDDASFHARFICGEPHMDRLVVGATAENPCLVSNDDHIELLLDTAGQPATYFQICVNAAGLGYLYPVGLPAETVRWEHAVRRRDDRWEATLRIAFAKDLPRPAQGAVWKINAVRLRLTEGREDSALVMGPGGFLCPALFLPLRF